MPEKFVKDRAHNRYKAYCCEDIDKIVGQLVEDVAALVAGTVPDGAVTLAKMAEDARTWRRELNKGLLTAEWIGTRAEYEEHVAQNADVPLPNVKYIITDDTAGARVTTDDYAVGSLVTVGIHSSATVKTSFTLGEIVENKLYKFLTSEFCSYGTHATLQINGKWRCIGYCGNGTTYEGDFRLYLFQRIE